MTPYGLPARAQLKDPALPRLGVLYFCASAPAQQLPQLGDVGGDPPPRELIGRSPFPTQLKKEHLPASQDRACSLRYLLFLYAHRTL